MIIRKSLILFACAFVVLLASQSCIHNDIPYPKIEQQIIEIEAVGQSSATIDNVNFSVNIVLDETTDPYNVRFSKFEYTPGATASLNLLEGTYDLSKPLKLTLSKYQDYEWVISASQNISRQVSIAGQIGETVIDPVGCRAIIRVPSTANLAALELTTLKLGPEGITQYSPDLTPGLHDFSSPVKVNVSYFGKTEEWTIYVERTRLLVSTDAVDAWSQVIWAYGSAPEGASSGFQYRPADSDTWLDVPAEWITFNGGSFTARIIHLQPLTKYVVRAVSDGNIGEEIEVTTEATMILPDGSFDQWWLNGKVWCPWNENGVQYWDTGNTGAATLGQSNVLPTDYTPTGSGQAVKLETKFVGIGIIGKLAAASIFTGRFAKVDGSNGILDFGRPWNVRPTRLRGYYQYTSAPISHTSEEYKYLLNQPDSCNIYIMLTDWTAPFEIRTNPKNRNLLDFNADYVIALGSISTSTSTTSYQEFDLPLVYRSTSRRPSYILVCAAASKLGDYFTGGVGSTLYIDQFSLEYDY